MDILIDFSHAYGSLLSSLRPYIGRIFHLIAPSMPYVSYAIGVSLEVLSPVLHTLRLLFLTLSSYGLRSVTSLLLTLPPALHPVLILFTLLFGLYLALLAVALLRRATAYLFRLLFNVAALAVLVGVGATLYQRGWTQTLQDAGSAAQLLQTWWAEGETQGHARKQAWRAEGYRQEKTFARAGNRAGAGGGAWW